MYITLVYIFNRVYGDFDSLVFSSFYLFSDFVLYFIMFRIYYCRSKIHVKMVLVLGFSEIDLFLFHTKVYHPPRISTMMEKREFRID